MKKIIKTLAVVMTLVMLLSTLIGCDTQWSNNNWEQREIFVDDNEMYKDYYQLCVYSFADSNNDGWGDFNGITAKLDYIKNLGYEGIWLSPLHPADSYHGYNVKDYYDVNADYGTMKDFENMVDKAEEKGITIMLDMVLNHSSNNNMLFKKFAEAVINGDTDSKYYNYYTKATQSKGGWYPISYGGKNLDVNGVQWYYEGNFSNTMAEFDLFNDDVRDELENILSFWIDKGVGAFRFDAVLYFSYGNDMKSAEFCKWLNTTIKGIDPTVYLIGEAWTSASALAANYYRDPDGLDSYMNFDTSNKSSNAKLMVMQNAIGKFNLDNPDTMAGNAQGYIDAVLLNQGYLQGKIDGLFSANHDTGRLASTALSYYTDRQGMIDNGIETYKFGTALLYTMSGNVYNYYGTEIGMRNGVGHNNNDSGDPAKRMAMNWTNENINILNNAGSKDELTGLEYFAYKTYKNKYVFDATMSGDRFGSYDLLGGSAIGELDLGGVAEQKDDDNSIYNYYRRIMLLRNQNPEIPRGVTEEVGVEGNLAVVKKTYNGNSIILVYNFNVTDRESVDLATLDCGDYTELLGYLNANVDKTSSMSGTKLTVSPQGIVVLGVAK